MNKTTVRKNLSIIKLQDKNQISQLNKLIMCNHKNYRKLILKYLNELNKIAKNKNLSVTKKNKILVKIKKNKFNTQKTYNNFNKKLENEKNKLIKKTNKIKKLTALLKGGSNSNSNSNNSLQREIQQSIIDMEERDQLNAALKKSLQEEKEKRNINTLQSEIKESIERDQINAAIKRSLQEEKGRSNSNSINTLQSEIKESIERDQINAAIKLSLEQQNITKGHSKWSERKERNKLNRNKTVLSKLNKKLQATNISRSNISRSNISRSNISRTNTSRINTSRRSTNSLLIQNRCLNVDINRNLPNKPSFSILKANGQNPCYMDALFMCLFHRRSSLNIIMNCLFNTIYENISTENILNENTLNTENINALKTKKNLVNIFCAKINELHNNNNTHIMDLEQLRIALENIKSLVVNEAAKNQMVNLTNTNVTFLTHQLDPSEVLDIINTAYESKKINIIKETDIDKINTVQGNRNSETVRKLLTDIDNLNKTDRSKLTKLIINLRDNNARVLPPRNNNETILHTLNIPFIDIYNDNEIKYMKNYFPKSVSYIPHNQRIETNTGSGIFKHTEFTIRELVSSEVILLKYKRETIVTDESDHPILNAVRNKKRNITHYALRTHKTRNIFIPLETFKVKNIVYECVSVIIHRGHSVRSGHYVCAIKYEGNNIWYLHDDTIRNLEQIGTFKDLINNEELLTNGVYFLYIKQ